VAKSTEIKFCTSTPWVDVVIYLKWYPNCFTFLEGWRCKFWPVPMTLALASNVAYCTTVNACNTGLKVNFFVSECFFLCVWCFYPPVRHHCYPHMPIGRVWLYRLLFVCLCIWTVTHFSAEDVQGRESPIFLLCSPRSPKSDNRPACGPRPPSCKHYCRDAPTETLR